jgi:hypothetical protein
MAATHALPQLMKLSVELDQQTTVVETHELREGGRLKLLSLVHLNHPATHKGGSTPTKGR